MRAIRTVLALAGVASVTSAFLQTGLSASTNSPRPSIATTVVSAHPEINDESSMGEGAAESFAERRDFLSSLMASGGALIFHSSRDAAYAAEGDDESFASIAARANKMSKDIESTRPLKTSSMILPTDKTVYDFSLPIAGVDTKFEEIVRQKFTTKEATTLKDESGQAATYRDAQIKAILVVNIKQDDVVARKTIPELIALAAKYGRGESGAFAVVACPTDQGYYEPDTSQLLRLKLASEYGYGINPSTVVTDKVNLLGTGAHPFWRWLQNTCRTPAGLGRIEGNFEKFLVDGRTGLPLRRYPRRYRPLNIQDDIEALLAGRPLPPAGANYLEEWRQAAAEAERDTYRFEKGLNVFDQ